ncbi:nickel-dependent hydrogenase large subunit [Geomonas sp. RF6]|uniref:hydrogenase large subunit n=1 Tax=Geomonas sp. RF6 TaxID=2897342 RepID=UPI001E2A6196|nr:nickel-dependent hydrogenase large subunit [Geomonas sp. RF6]UFS68550.1 nickel-dependent hydrogenase large subunit [Geomonas sp. RF6]
MTASIITLDSRQLQLEEPMYFNLEMDGDRVATVDVVAGQSHRGLETLVLKRNFYQNITLLERLCSLCSNSHPSTFCMALEEIAGIAIPERAEYLRVIADEIKRIASHLFNCALLAHIAGRDALFKEIMELREIMQDTKEAIYGNRMDLAANCLGGVRYDPSPEALSYLKGQMEKMKQPLETLLSLFGSDAGLRARMEGVGVLSPEQAKACGVVGPVARACGIGYDTRRKSPYFAYPDLPFEVVVEEGGDVRARALVRLREARESVGIIERCVERMPGGPVAPEVLPEVPAGEAIAKSEAPRGELLYYLVTDGSQLPVRLKWRVPSFMNWDALGFMLRGERLADIPLIVNSIDPCISCTDR